jgi:predicted  nucleic acid-binding Zn-ribbon protein
MNTNIQNGLTITIEDLAVMVKKGFDEMDRRFSKVDQKFIDIDERFDKIENRLDHLEVRFDVLEEKFDNLSDVVVKNHSVRIKRTERHLAIS